MRSQVVQLSLASTSRAVRRAVLPLLLPALLALASGGGAVHRLSGAVFLHLAPAQRQWEHGLIFAPSGGPDSKPNFWARKWTKRKHIYRRGGPLVGCDFAGHPFGKTSPSRRPRGLNLCAGLFLRFSAELTEVSSDLHLRRCVS